MKQLLEGLLNLFYPRCCPLCHRILQDQRSLVCPDCAGRLSPIAEPRCRLCGRPVDSGEDLCSDCEKGREFTRGRGIFLYDDRMKRSILAFKYGGRREYGSFFAEAIAAFAGEDILRWRPDLIVPVPMHPRSCRQRGFNQAEDLARKAGARLGIPTAAGLVKKRKTGKAQKTLDAAARRRNLRDAFWVTAPVYGLRILIIDDVFTTGSTVEAVAAALKAAGARDIFFVAVAIGVKKDFS